VYECCFFGLSIRGRLSAMIPGPVEGPPDVNPFFIPPFQKVTGPSLQICAVYGTNHCAD
jgi:hypothetical protein